VLPIRLRSKRPPPLAALPFRCFFLHSRETLPTLRSGISHDDSSVSAVVIDVDWSEIDIGNTTSGTYSAYNFGIADSAIQPWIAAGKTVNFVFQNTTNGGGSNRPSTGVSSNGPVGSNCAMPPWMWTGLSHYI